ncbi:MAG: 4-hydroxy-tetrahydrodipicolinate reductase [Nanoarchaeota archaeon]|nr:4-hydroxy-tetrahydrodipicolinate reductase [Nanoarchaeota archaeon]MBU1854653.1 4-hydroxy-tetrahydrodipicolinate reductase [Nanoarchaeota archaeon]
MTRITIIGYGKMGQTIERLAKEKGHKIVSIIDPRQEGCFKEINEESIKGADVCIDFTHPSAAVDNIKKVASFGKNIVVGTTGWYNQMNEVKRIVEKNNIGLIWSGNFLIGVNAFFKIIEESARIFNNLEDYDCLAYEMHHKMKADSPSGTAKMMSDLLIKNLNKKDKAVFKILDRQIEPNELHVASIRGGSIPGTHEVQFDSPDDTVSIKHVARSRNGFANGAIMAAQFIEGKKGFFNINDLMDDMIKKV